MGDGFLVERDEDGAFRVRGKRIERIASQTNFDVEESSERFSHRLLRDRHVAVVPGSAFGEGGEGMVRLSLAAPPDAIEAGLERLASLLAPPSTSAA